VHSNRSTVWLTMMWSVSQPANRMSMSAGIHSNTLSSVTTGTFTAQDHTQTESRCFAGSCQSLTQPLFICHVLSSNSCLRYLLEKNDCDISDKLQKHLELHQHEDKFRKLLILYSIANYCINSFILTSVTMVVCAIVEHRQLFYYSFI